MVLASFIDKPGAIVTNSLEGVTSFMDDSLPKISQELLKVFLTHFLSDCDEKHELVPKEFC